jgi:lipid-A-disaccharide synthase-like uncharacterized protein
MRKFALGLIVLSLFGVAAQAQTTRATSRPIDARMAQQARLLRQQVQQLQAQLDQLSPPDEQSLAQSPTQSPVQLADQSPAQLPAGPASQESSESKGLFRIMPANPIQWAWFLTGILGEFVFFLRFVVQWLASERAKKTVVPMMFWHLSLAGTAMVLAYAIYKLDPVFILAYSLNIFIYVRNLTIARRHQETQAVMEKTSE